MSSPPSESQPLSESGTISPSPEDIAAAVERRRLKQQEQQVPTERHMAAELEKKQKFRRLIDPGIIRPNSKEQAASTLQTLLTIAENLLREPENPKFRKFKSNNNVIKRNLMDPPGAIEYAIEMGFRPEVKDFEPYYVFQPKYMDSLRLGCAILHDAVQLEMEKSERAARSKLGAKAAAEAIVKEVHLAFMDDRQTQYLRVAREREHRAALAVRQQEAESDVRSEGVDTAVDST